MFKKIFLYVFVIFMIKLIKGDICNVCNCYKKSVGEFYIECQGVANDKFKIDLENIEWPLVLEQKMIANFDSLNMTVLPKILGDQNVISLSLNNNLLRTTVSSPFSHFKSLEKLYLNNNDIKDLPTDFLRMTQKLRQLEISNNKLSDIDGAVVSHLKDLRVLNLDYNQLTKLSAEFLDAITCIEDLSLEGNLIFIIEKPKNSMIFLKSINLSKNKLTMITENQFDLFENIESIDVSGNLIENIDDEPFTKLLKLQKLNLSNNRIIKMEQFKLPDSIKFLSLENNRLQAFEFHKIPDNLTYFEIQNNFLQELILNSPTNLKVLNVSNNEIEVHPNTKYISLLHLDMSYNQLTSVPQNLAERSPLLKSLILDHNPINTIDFVDLTILEVLSLRNMPLLKSIDANAFGYIEGRKKRSDGTFCADIYISHCPLLKSLNEDAFKNVELCKIDLSYNQLTIIPQTLLNWESLEGGINLQGNPLTCTCSQQWMLDIILKQLYENEGTQYLLKNLKCFAPEFVNGHRLVKYYKRKRAFCKSNSDIKSEDNTVFSAGVFSKNENQEIYWELSRGPGCIVVIIFLVAILLFCIGGGVYLTKKQDQTLKKINRFYESE